MASHASEKKQITIPFTCDVGPTSHDSEAVINTIHSGVTEVLTFEGDSTGLELTCVFDGLVSIFQRQSPQARRYFDVQSACAHRAAKGDGEAITILELFAKVNLKIEPPAQL